MQITRNQFKRIRHLLSLPRDSARISHSRFLCALAYMVSNGCKWRSLPARFGPWYRVYMRLQRGAHNGLLSEVLSHLQQERVSNCCVQALSLDSTIIKLHPMVAGHAKKTAHRP